MALANSSRQQAEAAPDTSGGSVVRRLVYKYDEEKLAPLSSPPFPDTRTVQAAMAHASASANDEIRRSCYSGASSPDDGELRSGESPHEFGDPGGERRRPTKAAGKYDVLDEPRQRKPADVRADSPIMQLNKKKRRRRAGWKEEDEEESGKHQLLTKSRITFTFIFFIFPFLLPVPSCPPPTTSSSSLFPSLRRTSYFIFSVPDRLRDDVQDPLVRLVMNESVLRQESQRKRGAGAREGEARGRKDGKESERKDAEGRGEEHGKTGNEEAEDEVGLGEEGVNMNDDNDEKGECMKKEYMG
ncbi:hypothetical protein R3P38DRAFT_2771802 [Favolaschia claudopus]|uniref:Uncharacterized protein n=1 Tax=Favolaschia claudopus TaxID=2862362 RepID=A0AAW0CD29_9AGAR